MRTGDFLQAGRDVGAVEIIGAAQLCDYQQMMADFRTRHQGIADALAKITAKTHLIKQARLIGIDATVEILGVKIAETALQPQPPPMISDVFIQQITAAGSILGAAARIPFPELRIIHTRLGTPVFRGNAGIETETTGSVSRLFLIADPGSQRPGTGRKIEDIQQMIPALSYARVTLLVVTASSTGVSCTLR